MAMYRCSGRNKKNLSVSLYPDTYSSSIMAGFYLQLEKGDTVSLDIDIAGTGTDVTDGVYIDGTFIYKNNGIGSYPTKNGTLQIESVSYTNTTYKMTGNVVISATDPTKEIYRGQITVNRACKINKFAAAIK